MQIWKSVSRGRIDGRFPAKLIPEFRRVIPLLTVDEAKRLVKESLVIVTHHPTRTNLYEASESASH